MSNWTAKRPCIVCKSRLHPSRGTLLVVLHTQQPSQLLAADPLCDRPCGCCVQAGLVYRAVKLRVRLHHWQRALELAAKHKQHVETVLMYRQR